MTLLAAMALLSFTARAQLLQSQVLFDFPTAASGEHPNELALGPDGNFYGTTSGGGSNGHGTVFKMTTNGMLTTLVSFDGTNGSFPTARLTLGRDGSFYSTAAFGGDGHGTVFKVTTNGVLTRLVSFTGTNGHLPYGGLTLGSDGKFYGTTAGTTAGVSSPYNGTVFSVTTNGTLSILAVMDQGAFPRWGLALGSDGNFYGTSYDGSGRVFKVTPGGTLTWLGAVLPIERLRSNSQGVTLGIDRQLYGTLTMGEDPYWSAVFQVSTNGTLSRLAWLPPIAQTPDTILTMGSDSNFYGATPFGISQVLPDGTVTLFASVPAGALTGDPQPGLTFGADGNLYGATPGGGSAGNGSIFRVRLPAAPVRPT
jgi:uncharacterized repeat protein (TIGR03803 family)